MPTYRRTLSDREQRRHEDQLGWLARAGLDVETSPTKIAGAVEVRIGHTANFFNCIFEHTIWLVLITGVRLVARKPGIRLVDELFVTLPWEEDLAFDFLPVEEKTEQYRIGRECFEKTSVINHLLADVPLPVGKPLEGLVIAQACGAKLPETYKLRDMVPISVAFADTLDGFYPADGQLTVAASFHTASRVPRTRSTLFDRDVSISSSAQDRANSFSKLAGVNINSNQTFNEGNRR